MSISQVLLCSVDIHLSVASAKNCQLQLHQLSDNHAALTISTSFVHFSLVLRSHAQDLAGPMFSLPPATHTTTHCLQHHVAQPQTLRCRRGKRGGLITRVRLLGPLLSSAEQHQEQQQQSRNGSQQQPSEPLPVAQKALSLLSWGGSGDKQNAADTGPEQQQEEQPARLDTAMPSDYMALMFVSLLWGSYTPALRYLYSMDELLTPQVRFRHGYDW